jgi:predicted fused transcriptional regulator/phosphomethylpyrimidine kinase
MKMNKNLHLVPEIVINIAESLQKPRHINEEASLQLRLEAIRDYCNEALEVYENKRKKSYNRG